MPRIIILVFRFFAEYATVFAIAKHTKNGNIMQRYEILYKIAQHYATLYNS